MAHEEVDSLGRRKRKCRTRVSPFDLYTNKEFQSRYRLSKKVVRRLVKSYAKHSRFKGTKKAGGLTHLDRFCLVLRYFASGSIYSTAAETQHKSTAALCRYVKDVSKFLYKTRKTYIRWPTSFEAKMEGALKFYRHKRKMGDGTEEEQKTPYVFGLVDGTHIGIQTPKDNEAVYVCRKGYHSINTMVVCDYDKRIIYIDPRFPGSVNDAYALRCSPLGDQVEKEKWGKFMLLGDSGYGLKRNLFTPYRKEDTPSKVKFNRWHKKNRVRVEQCLGILKQRWRILDSSSGFMRHDPQMAALIIIACACLHNVARNHGIELDKHPSEPYVPRQPRAPQPKTKSQREANSRLRKFRDDYADKYTSQL